VPPTPDPDYEKLLSEALARIPVHQPEWSNFCESDAGVALIELIAFLTESLLSRANQIADDERRTRRRRKFVLAALSTVAVVWWWRTRSRYDE